MRDNPHFSQTPWICEEEPLPLHARSSDAFFVHEMYLHVYCQADTISRNCCAISAHVALTLIPYKPIREKKMYYNFSQKHAFTLKFN